MVHKITCGITFGIVALSVSSSLALPLKYVLAIVPTHFIFTHILSSIFYSAGTDVLKRDLDVDSGMANLHERGSESFDWADNELVARGPSPPSDSSSSNQGKERENMPTVAQSSQQAGSSRSSEPKEPKEPSHPELEWDRESSLGRFVDSYREFGSSESGSPEGSRTDGGGGGESESGSQEGDSTPRNPNRNAMMEHPGSALQLPESPPREQNPRPERMEGPPVGLRLPQSPPRPRVNPKRQGTYLHRDEPKKRSVEDDHDSLRLRKRLAIDALD